MDGWNVVTLHNIQAFFLGRCGSLIVHTCMSAGLHSICCLQYKSHTNTASNEHCGSWGTRVISRFFATQRVSLWPPLLRCDTPSWVELHIQLHASSNFPWSPDALEVVWHPERENNSLLQQSLSFLQPCNVVPAQATHKDKQHYVSSNQCPPSDKHRMIVMPNRFRIAKLLLAAKSFLQFSTDNQMLTDCVWSASQTNPSAESFQHRIQFIYVHA